MTYTLIWVSSDCNQQLKVVSTRALVAMVSPCNTRRSLRYGLVWTRTYLRHGLGLSCEDDLARKETSDAAAIASAAAREDDDSDSDSETSSQNDIDDPEGKDGGEPGTTNGNLY